MLVDFARQFSKLFKIHHESSLPFGSQDLCKHKFRIMSDSVRPSKIDINMIEP